MVTNGTANRCSFFVGGGASFRGFQLHPGVIEIRLCLQQAARDMCLELYIVDHIVACTRPSLAMILSEKQKYGGYWLLQRFWPCLDSLYGIWIAFGWIEYFAAL